MIRDSGKFRQQKMKMENEHGNEVEDDEEGEFLKNE